jgi:gamma-glutamyl:cysteine ligase YbdK (ATP-grasp superfamily)
MTAPFRLFEAYGIELEYMIVDRESLSIRPNSDVALRDASGSVASDVEDGKIAWSNELAAHVIELKTAGPTASLEGLGSAFHQSLLKIEDRLAAVGAGLLPTAMHPFMDPSRDARLWAHENSEIYELYDAVFGCHGHGWTNLQSMHINLPFASDEEFGRLHAAIRLVLPILPALAASSPIEADRAAGGFDRRLLHYQNNQKRVPSIAGAVIPERAWTENEYFERILRPIYADIAPYDPKGLLRHDWLNSRGAIARFGRKTIEIRVIDLQESPASDIAMAKFACAAARAFALERISSQSAIRALGEERLKTIFDDAVLHGSKGAITDSDYLACWGFPASKATFRDLFDHALSHAKIGQAAENRIDSHDQERLELICRSGNLSERILSRLPKWPSHRDIVDIYQDLRQCLLANRPFQ